VVVDPGVRSKVAIVMATACLVLTGCQSGPPEQDEDVPLAHIHGLGIDPADDTLYAASHVGLFAVDGTGKPHQVADRARDFMGFTVVGDGHFLGSGHPGDGENEPPNLGLIESTDAGKTWKPRSLTGQVDFHAMEAKHDRVYGFDSQTGRIMVSADKQSWDERTTIPLADIAVSPDDADTILATTEQGVQRSTDGGREFAPISGSPPLIFLDWATSDRLVGVDLDGGVHTSADGGKSWSRGASVQEQPQAILAHGAADIYVATEGAIHRSTDNGKTFAVFQRL
jgi:photosystem II stability/assembly factor-like uncharacterized protein